ncbi:MAG: hypothetical protein KAU17_16640 [Spirochaetales bacterium]|nr:hypothetical protein [Spirochaetales bacterium]
MQRWKVSFQPGTPVDAEISMLVVEIGDGMPNSSGVLFNSNFTGWAPIVESPDGTLIPFKPFDSESGLDSFFYASNVQAGEYVLQGFMHVYTDYSKLGEGKLASYGPFANYPYHVRPDLLLDEPVVVQLNKAEIATFGRYPIEFRHLSSTSGTENNRWMMVPDSVLLISNPADNKALRVAKNRATLAWTEWNTRNPEEADDE